jgi:ATP-dependent Lon protease
MCRDAKNNDDDGDGDDGDGDSSEWDTDESNDGHDVRVRGKDKTVSITYVVGMRNDESDDDDKEGSDDEDEQSAPSDSDTSGDQTDPEELAEIASVIAELINDAMEDPRGRRRRGKGRPVSSYIPHTESEDDAEATNDTREPVVTRSKKRNSSSPSKKPVHKNTKATCVGKQEGGGGGTLGQYDKILGILKGGAKDDDAMEQAMLHEFGLKVTEMKKKKAEEDEKKRKKDEKPIRKKHCREFRKLMRTQSAQHPLDYFIEQPINRQKKLLTMLQEASKDEDKSLPLSVRILESKAPEEAKTLALRRATAMEEEEGEEGQKIKTWVDGFTQIPFGKYIDLPVRLGVNPNNELSAFMTNARDQLDRVVYGLDDAKTKLIEVLGQWVANPECAGCSIALKGPMGTGKTTLIKEGLSKIIGRPFEFIALGGSTDGSVLEGHGFTYVGSTWGEIVSILMRSKCMNPVVYFDELDKISQCPRGQEISGILTHLTDTAQNDTYKDRYFAGVPLDLSRVVFVFSYNDESMINPILLNRMFKIETKGYEQKEKIVIAREYLLPQLRKEYKLSENEVIFGEDALSYLVSVVSGDEKGVRDLKRGIATCLARLNLLRLGMPLESVIGKDEARYSKRKGMVEFPVTLDRDLAATLAKPPEAKHMSQYS